MELRSLGRKFLIFLLPVFGFAQIDKRGDFQIWQRNFLSKHLNDKWTLQFYNEWRFGDNASKFFYVNLQAQAKFKICSWLTTTPGYRQVLRRVPVNSNHWDTEYSPMWDATATYRFREWQLQDRNRVQYRIIQSNPYPWVYRNRLRLVAPPFLEDPKLALYADNEIFWQQADGIDDDRATVGLMTLWTSCFGGELFYMARFVKAVPSWKHYNILGLSVIFSF